MHIILQLCNFEYKYIKKVLFSDSHEPIRTFLVPDYCRATVKNNMSMDLLTLHDMHNMPTLSIRKKNLYRFERVQINHCFTIMFLMILQMNLHFSRIRLMVFNATLDNISIISCQSVLLVEETGVLR